MPTQQVAPAQCPNCRAQFTAPIDNIIDGQDPAQKAAFLRGQTNVIQCPQCGASVSPNIPVFYYDLEKEIAFVLVPPELNITGPDQEKMIGDLTNTVVNNLPTEQRKFYLFNPKLFLSRESMGKAILEADGVTEEMLEAQTAKARLIEEFLKAPDEATLKEKVKAHDDELDEEFFDMLHAYIHAAQLEGDQARFQTFFALRTIISELSTNGQKIVAEIDEKLGLVVIKSHEELLERLQNATDDEEIESLVAAGHQLLDYTFFQKLTAKIDQSKKDGDSKTTQRLTELRSKVLDIKSRHEEEAQANMEQAVELLKAVFQSGNPEKVLSERLDEINDAFFYVLRANIEEARRQKQEEPARAMEMIANMALHMLQEHYGGAAPDSGDQPAQEQPQILTSK